MPSAEYTGHSTQETGDGRREAETLLNAPDDDY